jgi:hypothetical protein
MAAFGPCSGRSINSTAARGAVLSSPLSPASAAGTDIERNDSRPWISVRFALPAEVLSRLAPTAISARLAACDRLF